MSTRHENGHAVGAEEEEEEKEVAGEVEEDGSGGLDMVNVSTDDAAFDEAVGCIEDIVVGTQFQVIKISSAPLQITQRSCNLSQMFLKDYIVSDET